MKHKNDGIRSRGCGGAGASSHCMTFVSASNRKPGGTGLKNSSYVTYRTECGIVDILFCCSNAT